MLLLPEETIKALRDSLFFGFCGYREAVGERRQALDHLLAVHTELCRIMPWDGLMKRRHNALVYRYVITTVAGNRAVAKKLNISKDTLYADLDGVIRDMLILCIGLPYLFQDGKPDLQATVKLILRNYPLLDRFGQLEESLCLFPANLRSSVREAREATRRSMQLFGRKEIHLQSGNSLF